MVLESNPATASSTTPSLPSSSMTTTTPDALRSRGSGRTTTTTTMTPSSSSSLPLSSSQTTNSFLLGGQIRSIPGQKKKKKKKPNSSLGSWHWRNLFANQRTTTTTMISSSLSQQQQQQRRKRRQIRTLLIIIGCFLGILWILISSTFIWAWTTTTTTTTTTANSNQTYGSRWVDRLRKRQRPSWHFKDPFLLQQQQQQGWDDPKFAKTLQRERQALNYGGRFDALILQLLEQQQQTEKYKFRISHHTKNIHKPDETLQQPEKSDNRQLTHPEIGNNHSSSSLVYLQQNKIESKDNPQEQTLRARPITDLLFSPPHHHPTPAGAQNNSPPATLPALITLANMEQLAPNCTMQEQQFQTTLVIQSTLDRVWLLQETCRRWSDPIVVVLVLSHEESRQEQNLHLYQWTEKCPQMRFITYALPADADPAMYPINHLRNLGLHAVRTSHTLVVDVDFIPSQDLNHVIRKTLELRHAIHANNISRQALIVPAFERVCLERENCEQLFLSLKNDSAFLPGSFDELRNCLRNENCVVFQSLDNWEGHYTTNSPEWLKKHWHSKTVTTLSNGTALRDIITVPCFQSLRYEPYVVIPWCSSLPSPYYDERFHGYGKNKIEYISHLRFLKFRFAILPQGFLIHNPHSESPAKHAWKRKEMDELYGQFLQELAFRYFAANFSWWDDYPQVIGLCPETKAAMQKQLLRHKS